MIATNWETEAEEGEEGEEETLGERLTRAVKKILIALAIVVALFLFGNWIFEWIMLWTK